MYKFIIFNFSILLLGIDTSAQTYIDFFPGMMKSDLHKANGKSVKLTEIEMSPAKSREVYLGKFFRTISSSEKTPIQYAYIGRVKTCRSGGCSINKSPNNEKESEYFDYYILYDQNYSVRQVRVFNYNATHGQEVTSKGWLNQFMGYNGLDPLIVSKNIDAISGATISVEAITFDIMHKTNLLRELTLQ